MKDGILFTWKINARIFLHLLKGVLFLCSLALSITVCISHCNTNKTNNILTESSIIFFESLLKDVFGTSNSVYREKEFALR